jgi:hypothetical protein
MLPVGVERDDRRCTVLEGVSEAGAEGGALAGVRDLAQDGRAGHLRLRRGIVGRAIVHHEDRQVGPCPRDHARDTRPFLVAGDQGDDRVHGPTVQGQRRVSALEGAPVPV